MKASNRWIVIYKNDERETFHLRGSYTDIKHVASYIYSVRDGLSVARKLPKYAYHKEADGGLQ